VVGKVIHESDLTSSATSDGNLAALSLEESSIVRCLEEGAIEHEVIVLGPTVPELR
jgi:hypothetical protein